MKEIGQSASFKNFSERNRIYVDKTEQIYSLLKFDRVFFSRPRRFGKSLVLDTIASLFEEGVEPYFKDTWIYDKWTEEKYPVLRLNFLGFSINNIEEFHKGFCRKIEQFVKRNNIDYEKADNVVFALDNLFESLSIAQKKIVILIDEYDCQMTANINNPDLYQSFFECIRSIYAILKGKEEIRFLAVTGVTRLKYTAIFSVGSDIVDMSNAHSIATLVGFTRDEIRKFYDEYLAVTASYANNCKVEDVSDEQKEEVLNKLAEEYDGYCFDEYYKYKVFSTWSVNNFFSSLVSKHFLEYGDYWYDNGGVSSILENYLESHNVDLKVLLDGEIAVDTHDFKNPTSLLSIDRNVLMYQTGYLTLCSKFDVYSIQLGIPNKEVKRALTTLMSRKIFGRNIVRKIDNVNFFKTSTADKIIENLEILFKSVSYENYPIYNEASLRLPLQTFFTAFADRVYVEQQNCLGRADLVVEIQNRRIVFELKYVTSEKDAQIKLQEAVNQIQERDYGNTYPNMDLLRIALVFNGDSKVRAFTHYQEVL